MVAKPFLAVGALLLTFTVSAHAAADPDKLRCVAALKLHSNDLAQQVKEGDAARRPELLQVLRQGGAFIGEAYLQRALGNEDQAKAELAQAEASVRALPAPQVQALRSQCGARANTMIENAPGWQRMVIDRFAQARMDKLLRQTH
ncbi:hypothetical protein [uncultured Azohydromonas sp.]|uniref:hypothetical protein n=1 Tax=uncultured Azohydromonas sp. TaxID=487342 RepID=UPI00261A9A58|nr:hypothetical protein [uncultured Azohydromonas sp.]